MKVLNTALLDKIVRRIVVALQPETIYLYGSHAYGQPHEDSDVDLLVVLREATRSGHEGAVEAYRALRGLCVPVEVQVVTRKEFERRAQWLSSVERVAKEKGRILYASSAGRSASMASESCA
jgi:predicted nucleotidyltransferase